MYVHVDDSFHMYMYMYVQTLYFLQTNCTTWEWLLVV